MKYSMQYIELPKNVTSFQKDKEGYHYFLFNGQTYYLSDILQKSGNESFSDNQLTLTVTSKCPKQDKLYLEYLHTGKPNAWCQMHNGIKKNEDIRRTLYGTQPWVNTPDFFFAE